VPSGKPSCQAVPSGNKGSNKTSSAGSIPSSGKFSAEKSSSGNSHPANLIRQISSGNSHPANREILILCQHESSSGYREWKCGMPSKTAHPTLLSHPANHHTRAHPQFHFINYCHLSALKPHPAVNSHPDPLLLTLRLLLPTPPDIAASRSNAASMPYFVAQPTTPSGGSGSKLLHLFNSDVLSVKGI
jgi:hypothetical protein